MRPVPTLRSTFALTALAMSVASVAQAASPLTVFKVADEWGTIQPLGPRTGVNGVRNWNVEGSDYGSFASTAPLRFYTADLTAQFDAQFGAGKWKISTINLVFSQNNAAFTVAGGISVFSFSNDALRITNGVDEGTPGSFSSLGVSPLKYSAGANLLDTITDETSDLNTIFGTVTPLGTYQFTENGSGTSKLDVLAPKNTDGSYRVVNPESTSIQVAAPNYGLSLPLLPGGTTPADLAETEANFLAAASRVNSNIDFSALIAELMAGEDVLSLMFVGDPATTATYKGNTNNGFYPPRMYVTAEEIAAPATPGDYNGDGFVDSADYTVWADNFGQTGSGLPGDGNGDGVVDSADYTVWADNFGQGTPPGGVAIPEPASAALLLAGLPLVMRRRR